MSVPGTLGCTMDAPADAAYAVLPVGVDIIRPDTPCKCVWYELMLPQRTMRPSTARVSEQLDPRFAASRHIPPPQSATLGLHPVACRKLLFISRPAEGRRLS